MPSGWGKGLAVKKGAHWGGLPERCSHTLGSGGCDIPTGLEQEGDPEPERKKGGGHRIPSGQSGRVQSTVLVSGPLVWGAATREPPTT